MARRRLSLSAAKLSVHENMRYERGVRDDAPPLSLSPFSFSLGCILERFLFARNALLPSLIVCEVVSIMMKDASSLQI